MLLAIRRQRLAEHLVRVLVGFLDEALWPEALHQFFFPDQPAVVLYQDEQGFECLGGQSEDLAVAAEQAFRHVELERAELEYLRLLGLHGCVKGL